MSRAGQLSIRQLIKAGHVSRAARRAPLIFAGFVAVAANRDSIVWAQAAPVAQAAPATAPSTQPLPAPIYWKQHLFLIPYQWNSAAELGAAQTVTLFVSKDHGVSWQKISDAKPQVKAFNYRAESDGEYWFAVRTLDSRGRSWPAGPYLPELRVIVDTTIPHIDELHARMVAPGAIDIQCRATDVNLNPASVKFEAQSGPAGAWQLVTVPGSANGQLEARQVPGAPFHAVWQPPVGLRPTAIRATISDFAGNSAVYQTPIETGQTMSGPLLSQPALSNGGPIVAPPVAASAGASTANFPSATAPTAPTTQPWPAVTASRAPLQLWTSGAAPADDGMTAYGNPKVIDSPQANQDKVALDVNRNDARVPAHYAGVATAQPNSGPAFKSTWQSGPALSPLEPYREPTAGVGPAMKASELPVASQPPTNGSIIPIDSQAAHRPTTQPKLVGSRTFALEYDLDDTGGQGVSKVELWGTRDAGRTWNRYAQDDDNRSPIIVTVDDEGLYGFRILVQSAKGPEVQPPRSGDEPELWVSVDLKRPIVELTSIERGQGNLADHLILHWRAQDNNLDPRPISLYFSSRPTGPWSAIATNLEDTGEYAWRVERYVPTRFYLRVEAHDTAGNQAAFQTREPVEFSPPQLTGRLRAAAPAGPKAVGGADPYR